MWNIINILEIFYIATKRIFIEQYTYRVSALAFTTFLSLVPLLSISVFFVTMFPIFNDFISSSENYIFEHFVPSVAGSAQVYVKNFKQQATHLPILSILFLLFSVLLMMNTIDESINDIWMVKIKRKGLIVWLFYAIILLIAPNLIGFSIFITSYVMSFYFFTKITWILLFVIPIIINTIIFSLFYLLVPNTRVRISDGILGAFIVAIFLELARILFAMYISNFSNYELIYGAFAILPIILIWLYLFWFIILWGCLFIHTLSQKNH